MDVINIMYQCDNNFAFMAGVSFTSLVINSDKNIQYVSALCGTICADT